MSEVKGVQGCAIQGRFSDLDVKQVDDWRRQQRTIPSRADALRVLVRRGLQAFQQEQGPATSG